MLFCRVILSTLVRSEMKRTHNHILHEFICLRWFLEKWGCRNSIMYMSFVRCGETSRVILFLMLKLILCISRHRSEAHELLIYVGKLLIFPKVVCRRPVSSWVLSIFEWRFFVISVLFLSIFSFNLIYAVICEVFKGMIPRPTWLVGPKIILRLVFLLKTILGSICARIFDCIFFIYF